MSSESEEAPNDGAEAGRTAPDEPERPPRPVAADEDGLHPDAAPDPKAFAPAPAREPERRRPRVVVAVQDRAARERLGRALANAGVDLTVLEPTEDPLSAPPDQPTDVLIVRRSEVRPEDLRLVDAYTEEDANPGLVVVPDKLDEADRVRLLAVGASGVLGGDESSPELRAAVEAIASAGGQDLVRAPAAGAAADAPRLSDFLSRSPRMRRFLDLVHRVVDSDSSLLVTGETGVGKERLAQAIHNESPRAGRPFVSINCGAIPEALLESELFGHEAGAFTGATRRKKGRFEQAQGGTIFLDEIGEMPLHLQVNLLTVLQRRRIQRVGSEESLPIDVRVMAATNRDVEAEVRAGRFREDLYYRLNVVTLAVPPLRERSEDVPVLVGNFIRHFRDALGRRNVEGVSPDALDVLMRWRWPGNVRELVNAVEHAIVLARSAELTVADLPDHVVEGVRAPAPPAPSSAPPASAPTPSPDAALHADHFDEPLADARRAVVDAFERAYLAAQLRATGGRVGAAATRAGISARALHTKMKKHGLRKEDFR